MKSHEKKDFAAKHPVDREVAAAVLEAVKDQAREGEIPCAGAFAIAEELSILPAEVGVAADKLGIRLTLCQLGLFGYRPAKKLVKPLDLVPLEMEKAIRGGLRSGRLPCNTAWEISERLGAPKMEVSSSCEALGIKIGPCQLGAF